MSNKITKWEVGSPGLSEQLRKMREIQKAFLESALAASEQNSMETVYGAYTGALVELIYFARIDPEWAQGALRELADILPQCLAGLAAAEPTQGRIH